MRTGGAIFSDVALADAGARADPFVVGRDHFLEVGVGKHLGGNIACNTRDFCRDAVRHVSPWELQQSKRIRNSKRCRCEVTRRERKIQGFAAVLGGWTTGVANSA